MIAVAPLCSVNPLHVLAWPSQVSGNSQHTSGSGGKTNQCHHNRVHRTTRTLTSGDATSSDNKWFVSAIQHNSIINKV